MGQACLPSTGLSQYSTLFTYTTVVCTNRPKRLLSNVNWDEARPLSPQDIGSRVCVHCAGHRHAKLNKHHFHGIFLGYMVTNHNIQYINLDSGLTKTSHHTIFDEAWYTSIHKCPPAAQFLYELGLKHEKFEPPATSLVVFSLPPLSLTPTGTQPLQSFPSLIPMNLLTNQVSSVQ